MYAHARRGGDPSAQRLGLLELWQHLPLAAGTYPVSLCATAADEVADRVEHALPLRVETGDVCGTGRATIAEKHGPFVVRHTWRADEADEEDGEKAP